LLNVPRTRELHASCCSPVRSRAFTLLMCEPAFSELESINWRGEVGVKVHPLWLTIIKRKWADRAVLIKHEGCGWTAAP
jgi:hypothetical protein